MKMANSLKKWQMQGAGIWISRKKTPVQERRHPHVIFLASDKCFGGTIYLVSFIIIAQPLLKLN